MVVWAPKTFDQHLERAPFMWGREPAEETAADRAAHERMGGAFLYPGETLQTPWIAVETGKPMRFVGFHWRQAVER